MIDKSCLDETIQEMKEIILKQDGVEIAQCVHDSIELEISNVEHCMVHENPYIKE